MNSIDRWGPFALDLDPAERLARTRSLRAIIRLLLGPRGADLAGLLYQAEADPAALVPTADALDRLAPLDMRKVLASYAGLARPLPPARCAAQGYSRPVAMVTPRPPVRVTPSKVARAQPSAGGLADELDAVPLSGDQVAQAHQGIPKWKMSQSST